ncbi:hypothetical protein DERP_015303 [Dermatophagoides pteronyssinus]|uniref:Uncharacterized protein n=1 Tax=Dermatophagoides pteronyssinus TaxID=6956 RepID=A0ABQ8JTM5_DERPT|nr:hypothetical protein DERP_015303 [Dermatophagoides pteronyssinus]
MGSPTELQVKLWKHLKIEIHASVAIFVTCVTILMNRTKKNYQIIEEHHKCSGQFLGKEMVK